MTAQLRDTGRRVAPRGQEFGSMRFKIPRRPNGPAVVADCGRLAGTTVGTAFYRVTLSLEWVKR